MNVKLSASPENLLGEKKVAEILGLSVRTVQMRRLKGGGPIFIKIGSRCLYRPSDVEEFIRSCAMTHTSEPAK